jgi:capsid portal protein
MNDRLMTRTPNQDDIRRRFAFQLLTVDQSAMHEGSTLANYLDEMIPEVNYQIGAGKAFKAIVEDELGDGTPYLEALTYAACMLSGIEYNERPITEGTVDSLFR